MFEHVTLDMRLRDLGYDPIVNQRDIVVEKSERFTKSEINTFLDLSEIYNITSCGIYHEKHKSYIRYQNAIKGGE